MSDYRIEQMPWQREATRDWQERFEALGRAKGVTDNALDHANPTSKMNDLFLTYVGKDAYSQIKSLVAPRLPHELTYADIKAAIKTHLQPKTIEIAERYKFHMIRQNNTAVATFVSNLRRAAETCNFAGQLENNLRDRFVVGLDDESVVRKLLLEDKLTLDKAVNAATNAEEVRVLQAQMKSTSYSVNAMRNRQPEAKPFQKDWSRKTPAGSDASCRYCGRTHPKNECPAYGKTCHKCSKKNHFSSVCRAVNAVERQSRHDSDSSHTSDVLALSGACTDNSRCMVVASLDGHALKCMIDTGSGPSIVPWSYVKQYPDLEAKCTPTCETLVSFSGGKIPVKRKLEDVHFMVGGKEATVSFMVADRGQPLLGMDIIGPMQLVTLNVNTVSLGERVVAEIEIDPNAKPKFCKPRKLPFALEEPVKQELERLQALGIVQSIESSEWATPIVVVHKPDKRVRICGDYQTTINPHVPSSVTAGLDIDDTLAKLAGCVLFSKIDVKDAYLQVPLDSASQLLTVISTPFGLYKYTCLPFGVKSASHIFQTKMNKLMFGLHTVHCHLDDVLIASKTGEDHDKLLQEVKSRLAAGCLPINERKYVYKQKEISNLGYNIRADEIRPDTEKVKNMREVPVPKEAKELQRFVCAAGYYSKFIPSFSDVVHPLRQLVNSDSFEWKKEHSKAFEALKEALCGGILKSFDPKEDVELSCDASGVAVGAVLSQCGRPVLYTSKTLSVAERNYSQLDREALAIVYAVKRLHKYLYGRTFRIITDHRPLEFIFKQDGCKSAHANQRVIRWGVFLSNYDYQIVGMRTNEIPVADMLSRVDIDNDPKTFDVGAVDVFHDVGSELRDEIYAIFDSCKQFAQLKQYVKFGWPKVLKNISLGLRQYYRVRDELSFHDKLLYRKGRAVIPKPLRQTILDNLHSSHLGMVKMKSLARSRYWWPGMDDEIEATCRGCGACQRVKKPPASGTETSWPLSTFPFQRVHVDYAGPMEGFYYLLVVDSYSNYPFVFRTTGETAAETLGKLKELFGMFGLPKAIVSDNGPAFRSEEFRQYFMKRGVELWPTPVGHPKSNGLVERFVGNFKMHMKITEGKGDIDSRMHSFLLQYRCAAVRGGKSPSDMVFTYVPRMPVMLLQPGQPIFCQNFRKNLAPTFERGVVISTTGNSCVNVHDLDTDKVHTRHFDQVKAVQQPEGSGVTGNADLEVAPSVDTGNAEVTGDAELGGSPDDELDPAGDQGGELDVDEPRRLEDGGLHEADGEDETGDSVAEELVPPRRIQPGRLARGPKKFDDYFWGRRM
jgi:transposase InsO family protein